MIKASIVKGQAPLLISRSALKSLGATLDFGKDRLRVFSQDVPLEVNQAGQYVVNLLSDLESGNMNSEFAEVMTIGNSDTVEKQVTEEPAVGGS